MLYLENMKVINPISCKQKHFLFVAHKAGSFDLNRLEDDKVISLYANSHYFV